MCLTKNCLLQFILLTFLFILTSSLSGQSIYYVNSNAATGGDGISWNTAFNDLQDALEQACTNSPADIWVAKGNYYPSKNSGDSTSGPADRTNTFMLCNGVALYGGFMGNESSLSDRDWENNTTILNGDLMQDDSLHNNSYHVIKADSIDQSAILDGFTITNGYADIQSMDVYQATGGGMCLVKSSPLIQNCIIKGNSATTGGGVLIDLDATPQFVNVRFIDNHIISQYGSGGGMTIYTGGAPSFINCDFADNVAAYNGGAVFNVGGKHISFLDCTFTNNTGRKGGGLYSTFDSHTDITRCSFIGNHVTGEGGAILNNSGSGSIIRNCIFEGNSAEDYGGAVENTGNSHTTVYNSTFTSNSSSYIGGAWYNSHSQLRMYNVIMRGNTSLDDGGAIYLTHSYSYLTHLLLSGNIAGSSGGGINSQDSPLWLINSTISGNKSAEGGGIYNWSDYDPFIFNSILWNNISGQDTFTSAASIFNRNASSVEISNSIIANSGGSTKWNPALGNDRGNNLDSDPQFLTNVDLDSFPNNTGDLHLQAISPAINAGSLDTAKLKLQSIDLDNQPRIVHGRIDLGPYEFQSAVSLPDCDISGLQEVFSFTEEVYHAANGLNSLAWLIEGNARIIGPTDQTQVTVRAGATGNFLLVLTTTDVNQVTSTCALNVRIKVDCTVFDTLTHVYVNSLATGNQTGLSWEDAFTDLQSALQINCGGVEEIWVANGYYTPTTLYFDREATFQLLNEKKIYGGFIGNEIELDQRDFMNNHTELTGDIDGDGGPEGNAFNVVTGSNTNRSAILDGFTISSGSALVANVTGDTRYDGGGGMYNEEGSPTIINCVFLNNEAGSGAGMRNIHASPRIDKCKFVVNYAGDLGQGGGMMNTNYSSPEISNTMFWENVAHLSGAGMLNINSSPALDSCVFRLNELKSSIGKGAGMYNLESSPVIESTDFTENFGPNSSSGSGMYNLRSSPELSNCQFDGNKAKQGAGMFNKDHSSPQLNDCFFFENSTKASGSGGGIWNEDSSNPILMDCRFESNSAIVYGGGIYNDNASPILHRCTFYRNSVDDEGGAGIFNMESSPELTDCHFDENESGFYGGGIYNEVSSPRLHNCVFTGNSSSDGSGICNRNGSSPRLTNCTFQGNNAGYGGGGIENKESSPAIINCLFSNNTAGFEGGAMYSWDGSSPSLINSIFKRNTAGDQGGALSNGALADPMIVNCTFSGNEAVNTGGAIATYFESNPRVINSIIWNNKVGNSTDGVIASISSSDSSSLPSIAYSLIDNSGGSPNWDNGTGIDLGHNIDMDPMFVSDVLFENLPDSSGDLHLLETSFAINTGNPDTTGLSLPIIDYDGNQRIFQNRIDMGAYEFQQMVSISNLKGEDVGFLLFPNPANDIIEVITNIPKGDVFIYDLQGFEVMRRMDITISPAVSMKLPVKHFAPGTYLFIIRNEQGEQFSGKFIVL